tara:strand:+ start:620 stop:2182 length:1563 start_codon:yes stop_codon:yes gene_type:complete
MHQKMLVICLTQHHFEKGLYLSMISIVPIEIACIGFQPKQVSKGVHDKSQCFGSLSKILPFINQYEKFIFFNTSPSKQLFKLISGIRKVKKNIIAIQETHQLGMHLGAVNSIIFSPDLIIAASDLEKKLLNESNHFIKDNIMSPGWLFQSEYHTFTNTLQDKHSSYFDKKYVLVLFSAPNDITASSAETYEIRNIVLQTIQKQFKNITVLIKLHPLESIKPFKRYLKQEQIQHFAVLDHDQNIWDLAHNAHGLITSNRTQAFVDLIEHDKRMLIYQLGDENFISSYLKENNTKKYLIEGVHFYEIKNPLNDLKMFKKIHCKSEETAKNFFIDLMLQRSFPINKNVFFEEAAWAFIFRTNNSFKNLIKESEFSRSAQINKIFDQMSDIDFLKLDTKLNTLSIRTSISLIIMREMSRQNFIVNDNLKDFVEIFFTSHIIQYFYIDSISFEFFLSRNKKKCYIRPEAINLLQATKIALAKKSIIMKCIFFIEKEVSAWNSNLFKGVAYSFINLVLIIMRNIRR